MSELLDNWLNSIMGLCIQMRPEIFGLQMKDGTVVCNILLEYDIISTQELHLINQSSRSDVCLSNWQKIAQWLRRMRVTCDSELIESIAEGKGSAALRLLYLLFLCLEGQDLVQSAAESKKSVVTKERYVRRRVPVILDDIKSDYVLSEPLKEKQPIINWFRERRQVFADRCASAAEKHFNRNPPCKPIVLQKVSIPECRRDTKEILRKAVQNEILTFEKRKNLCSMKDDLPLIELLKLKEEAKEYLSFDFLSHEEMQKYVKEIKFKSNNIARKRKFKQGIHVKLISDLWGETTHNHRQHFNVIVSRKLLKQSEYEKQISRKISNVKHEERMMRSNVKINLDLLLRNEQEMLEQVQYQKEDSNTVEKELNKIMERREQELQTRLQERRKYLEKKRALDICLSIISDIFDIAMKAISIRYINEKIVPWKFWDEWRTLFLKSQPITEKKNIIDLLEAFDLTLDQKSDPILVAEMERQNILNDHEVDLYLNLQPVWDLEILPLPKENFLLAHVVFHLFELVYPTPAPPDPPVFPDFSLSAFVLGLHDINVIQMLQQLLDSRSIHLIILENIIPIFIEAYKREAFRALEDDLEVFHDQSFGSEVKKISLKRSLSGLRVSFERRLTQDSTKSRKSTLSSRKKSSRQSAVGKHSLSLMHQNRGTQFPSEVLKPKIIDLSPAAKLGKEALQTMSFGEKISDRVLAKLIVEYLKKLNDVKGWVLLNYPNRLEQAVIFEEALSGRKVNYPKLPEVHDVIIEDAQNRALEYLEEDFAANEFKHQEIVRYSRLVKDPTPKEIPPEPKTYLTRFVNVRKCRFEASDTSVGTISMPILSPIEMFYVEQGIYVPFILNNMDFSTVKQLAKIIIHGMPDVVKLKYSDDPGIQFLTKLKEEENMKRISGTEEQIEGLEGIGTKEDSKQTETLDEAQNYVFMDLSLPDEVPSILLGIWRKIEHLFIKELKRFFLSQRAFNESSIIYAYTIKTHFLKYVARPDKKYIVVDEFQKDLNETSKDIREDLEGKIELYMRVQEFQEKLLQICVERREEAEKQRCWIITEGWAANEMIMCTTIFIYLVQVEGDRAVETLQFLYDHFLSMLGNLPVEERLHRISVPIIELLEETEEGTRQRKATRQKPNVLIEKGLDVKQIGDAIKEMLINENKPSTHCHTTIIEVVNYITKELGRIRDSFNDIIKKYDPEGAAKAKAGDAGKKDGAPQDKIPLSPGRQWAMAVEYEAARVMHRLQLIQARAQAYISEVQETLQNLFYSMIIFDDERYERELASISALCEVLCWAIEEERGVQQRLLLEDDNFFICNQILTFPHPEPPPPPPVRERLLDHEFQVNQIEKLYDIFFRRAPSGYIPHQAFGYLLGDVISNSDEEDGPLVPKTWKGLGCTEICFIVDTCFGLMECVNWTDFLIYALNLRYPTQRELLVALEQFEQLDENHKGAVDYASYTQIQFWFEKDVIDDPQIRLRLSLAKETLFQMFLEFDRVNYRNLLLSFCKSNYPKWGLAKAFALLTGKLVFVGSRPRDSDLLWFEEIGKETSPVVEIAEEIEISGVSSFEEYSDNQSKELSQVDFLTFPELSICGEKNTNFCDKAVQTENVSNIQTTRESIGSVRNFEQEELRSTEPFIPRWSLQDKSLRDSRESGQPVEFIGNVETMSETEIEVEEEEEVDKELSETELSCEPTVFLEKVSWLLLTCFPWLRSATPLTDEFQNDIRQMFIDLCGNTTDPVPISSIIQHSFMKCILESVNKFKIIDLEAEIARINS